MLAEEKRASKNSISSAFKSKNTSLYPTVIGLKIGKVHGLVYCYQMIIILLSEVYTWEDIVISTPLYPKIPNHFIFAPCDHMTSFC